MGWQSSIRIWSEKRTAFFETHRTSSTRKEHLTRRQMLIRICGVGTPSYPEPATCLGSAGPTGVMRSLITHSVLRALPARQRLARSSLGQFWAVWGANTTSVPTHASASHPLELPGLDLSPDIVPEGWPRLLSVSTSRYGWGFATPQVYPSARFGANAAWLRLQVLTFNLLELLKAAALDPQYRNARPKRLRFAIFTQFGRVVRHAHRQLVRLANLVWGALVVPGRRKIAASIWPST